MSHWPIPTENTNKYRAFFDDEVQSIMGIITKTSTTPNSSVGSTTSQPRRIPNKKATLSLGGDEYLADSVISSDEELCNERRYEWATWQMYNRIKAARAKARRDATSIASATRAMHDVQIHVRAPLAHIDTSQLNTDETDVDQDNAFTEMHNDDLYHPEVFHLEI